MIEQVLVLHLGSNQGDRFAFLSKALVKLSEIFGPALLTSSVYETKAWGNTSQPDFLNQAVVFNSASSPTDILDQIKSLEIELGRKKNVHWGEREIDIDILFLGDNHFKLSGLEIPHPQLHLRRFVLEPLIEIIPDYMHPVFAKTIRELYNECEDPLAVNAWKPS